MMQKFYRLAPNRVWRSYLGGRTLDTISGAEAPADTHFPEDWLLSTTRAANAGREEVSEGVSQIVTHEGIIPFTELLEKEGKTILGEKHIAKYGLNPGFLLKYLDSSIRLNIQCHPTIPFAQKYLNSNSGKSEGYYILGIRPGCEGYIYLGFQNPPAPEAFREMIGKQDIGALLACFEKIPVKTGDAFFVPGGFPHAIGEGVFMIEIMEPTDFAVRIEFERGGYVLPESSRFMNRGIDFAVSMFDFRKRSSEMIRKEQFLIPLPLPVGGQAERFSLFDRRCTRCFRAEKIIIRGGARLKHDSFRVLIVTAGEGKMSIDGEECILKQYDRLLIPAAEKEICFADGSDLELVAALPPEV